MNAGKYKIVGDKIVSKDTGEPIPDDEPIVIIRARDVVSKKAIGFIRAMYERNDIPLEKLAGLRERIEAFHEWQIANPDKLKIPGVGKPFDIEQKMPTPEEWEALTAKVRGR